MDIRSMLKAAWPEWELIREIGTGSQGSVYMIRRFSGDSIEEDYAALKVILLPTEDGWGGREEALQTFEMMKEALAHPDRRIETRYGGRMQAGGVQRMLAHPNIVRLKRWGVGTFDGRRYLLMLMELLLPLDKCDAHDAARVGKDICRALSALHQNGIFHLDVKPGNILVDRDGVYKLGDFGSSRDMAEIEKGDFPLGTLHYAAPELLTTRRMRNTWGDAIRADIYSLGMVLYELLTWEVAGFRIFGPENIPDEREVWFRKRREHESVSGEWEIGWFPFGKEPPKALWEVMLKATSADPDDRYWSADDMLEAIERAEKADAKTSNRTREQELAKIGEAFHVFLNEDGRKILIVRRPNATYQFDGTSVIDVGKITGVRLTYIGYEPPESILFNGEEIGFRPENGFIDLSLREIYGEQTWPNNITIEVCYPRGWRYQWKIILENGSHGFGHDLYCWIYETYT